MGIKKIVISSIIIILGIVLGLFILKEKKIDHSLSAEDSHMDHSEEHGPHGGKLLKDKNLKLEVTIYEKGVEPEFRLYPYFDDKLIPLDSINVILKLTRFGNKEEIVHFKKQDNYLLGDLVVREPHSFDVKIQAVYNGIKYNFKYSQYEGRVEISDKALEKAGVEISTAGPYQLQKKIELPGVITLNHEKIYNIVSSVKGIAKDIYIVLGDKVKNNYLIANIESQDVANLKSEYITWKKKLELNRKIFDQEKYLWSKNVSSERDYLNAKYNYEEANIYLQKARLNLSALGLSRDNLYSLSYESNLATFPIRSPIDGIVLKKDITAGEAVNPGTSLFTIADLSTVFVEINVHPDDLKSVSIGQNALISSKELGISIQGKISYIDPILNKKTRTIRARVRINNKNGDWKAGLFVNAEILHKKIKTNIAVPLSAIQKLNDSNVVFIKYRNKFEASYVELGRSDGEWVEILEGLSLGEKYVSKNSFLIKADILKSGATHDH